MIAVELPFHLLWFVVLLANTLSEDIKILPAASSAASRRAYRIVRTPMLNADPTRSAMR